MRELIQRLRKEKDVTVLMSSHVLPEVESICDVVGIFDHGRLVAVDTIENLRSTSSNSINLEMVLAVPNENLTQLLSKIDGVNHVQNIGLQWEINTVKDPKLHGRILFEALNNGAQILSFGPKESSLEDILLRLVQTDFTDVPDPKQGLFEILSSFIYGRGKR
jgi:ABC-2 type transport system ATP-binding protein